MRSLRVIWTFARGTLMEAIRNRAFLGLFAQARGLDAVCDLICHGD